MLSRPPIFYSSLALDSRRRSGGVFFGGETRLDLCLRCFTRGSYGTRGWLSLVQEGVG